MDSREAYIEELETRLQERAERIDALKARAEHLGRKDMFVLNKKIEGLEDRQRALHARLLGMRTGAAWEDLKEGTEQAWQELTTLFDDALDALGTSADPKERGDDRS